MHKELYKNGKNPEVLVVTPLLPGHKISSNTRKTIKRNKSPFLWVKTIGDNNIPTNVQNGLNYYKKLYKSIKYLLPIDNDVILGRNFIDRLLKKLKNQPKHIAYAYASFEFKGIVNASFPAINFDIQKLLQNNYISSNSLIKIEALDEVGGFVTNNEYIRLLDWCLWLKMLKNGKIGINCPETHFVATTKKNDISTRSNEDFQEKRKRVIQDFILPLVEEIEKTKSK